MSLFSIGHRPRPFSEQKGTCQLILRPRERVSAGVPAPKAHFFVKTCRHCSDSRHAAPKAPYKGK